MGLIKCHTLLTQSYLTRLRVPPFHTSSVLLHFLCYHMRRRTISVAAPGLLTWSPRLCCWCMRCKCNRTRNFLSGSPSFWGQHQTPLHLLVGNCKNEETMKLNLSFMYEIGQKLRSKLLIQNWKRFFSRLNGLKNKKWLNLNLTLEWFLLPFQSVWQLSILVSGENDLLWTLCWVRKNGCLWPSWETQPPIRQQSSCSWCRKCQEWFCPSSHSLRCSYLQKR